jgi:hypothetical protein
MNGDLPPPICQTALSYKIIPCADNAHHPAETSHYAITTNQKRIATAYISPAQCFPTNYFLLNLSHRRQKNNIREYTLNFFVLFSALSVYFDNIL